MKDRDRITKTIEVSSWTEKRTVRGVYVGGFCVMTDDELKEYIRQTVTEAIRSAPVVGVPPDPDLLQTLDKLATRVESLIQVLAECLPECNLEQRIADVSKTIETKQQQDVQEGIRGLDDYLDVDADMGDQRD